MTQGVAIQLERVEKRFDAQPVLSRLDLAIAPGEFVAVIGKSGSGKSTLLRLVAGLDQPSAGAVVIDGQRLRGRNSQARVMFQDARLLPWKSVRENVGLGLPASGLGERAAEALEHVGLHDRGGAWPLVLSGGERQRVALARALVSGPRLLLLDEPLGALDALTRIEMQLLIERLWQEQGFTAVLITHDVEEAVALADRVVLIEHGQIALDQPIDLPRPRARGSAAFAALKGQLLQRVIGSGWGV